MRHWIKPGFRARLLLTLIGLMLVVQTLTAIAVLREAYMETRRHAEEQLLRSRDILDQIMANRASQLLDTVSLMAADYGFRTAIASSDTDTIESVLSNHGDRIGAGMMLLADLHGQLITSTHATGTSREFPFPDLLQEARANGHATAVGVLQQQAWHLVLVPVKAPEILAWVGMGFPLDRSLAQMISQLSGVEVSFIHMDQATPGIASPDNDPAPLLQQMLTQEGTAPSLIHDTDGTLILTHRLLSTGSEPVDAVLALQKDQAFATFHSLQRQLLILFGLSVLGSILASVWLARQLGKPLIQLASAAQRIGQGEYMHLSASRGSDEIGVLARTLETMQQNIKNREQRMHHQARHDPLTGLPNRITSDEYLQECLLQRVPALMIRLSLRDLKAINDSLGYRIGDEALQAVANRLRKHSGQDGLLARTGSKDFVLVLPNAAGTTEEETLARIEFIRQQIEKTIHLQDSPITLRLVMGALCLPGDACDLNTLWRRATITFDASQKQGGATQLYRSGMDESHMRALSLMRDLAGAISDGQLSMRYQPKLSLIDRQIHQFEALVRWQHPTLGFVPPDEFIMLAERSGQIGLVTRWVLTTVIQHLKLSWSQGVEMGAAINLSAHDLLDSSLPPFIENLLADWSGPRQRLTLEVTESALMEDPVLALQTLEALKALGLRLSIDDFGTGYSSLAQLKRLPVDELKIDKSFVLKLDQDTNDQTIVRSTIDLAHSLGLNVVAEGVETAAGWILLEEYGCDTLQGYFIARPLPSDEVKDWLHSFEERRPSLPPPYLAA